jgi:thiamine pyrophosphokinase
MKAVLVCSGTIADYDIISRYAENCELLIGVDGGVSHILAAGFVPDMVFGDLDSIRPEDLHFIQQKNIETHKFNVEKDFTDSAAALSFTIREGYENIIILGAVGNRTDHMIANIINLRSAAEAGVRCSVIDDANEITAFSGRYHRAVSDLPFESRTVSLIALTEKVIGITTKGLKYQLFNAMLGMSNPSHGVSNVIIDDSFEIEIAGDGVLLVVFTKEF